MKRLQECVVVEAVRSPIGKSGWKRYNNMTAFQK